MKKSRISVFLAMTLAAFTSTSVLAQDVVVDFAKEGKANGQLQTLLKEGNVSFKFVGSNSEPYGAYIYGIDYWASVFYLTIESPSDIAVIEYQVATSGTKSDELSVTTGGPITKNADNTRVWKGPAKKLTFTGALSNTDCSISRLRLWYNESEYTPGTSWETEENKDNPYAADINLAEDTTDYTQVDRAYAPVNILPRNGRGVPMAVVSAPQFKTTLDSYLKWKTKQGYEVTEIYTNEIPGQKSGEELAYAIREKLKNLTPRPAYVLLVGDVNELPSFTKVGAADLYYGEYTDDYFTDAYVGRFSATTTTQLEAQMKKTRYMAYLTPENGDWLKHSLTLDDITPEISVMNPASALSLNYPLNFKDNTSYKTSTGWLQSINSQIEQGCSYVSYFGHGGPCMWHGIYTTDNANALNNTNKYPVVFSITCHAGNFAYSQQSLAEAFMQRSNAGAVAVIASSRESRSDSNYRYFFGEHSDSRYACAGLLRSLFPCVGTDLSQRARTIGQALEIGKFAVARTMSDDFYNNTEMYNLLGDPTYQPYITTPKENKLYASSSISTGRNLMVSTVPDAMVCLSKDRTVIAAAMSDANGKVTLHVPATAPTGECTLYTSAPGYNDLEQVITLTAGNGSEELLDETETPLNITYTDVISLETIGNILSYNWGTQQSFSSTTSPAQYLICAVNDLGADNVTGYRRWLNKDAAAEGIFIRDNHKPCSIVTTNSAGKARRVSIDWLHPTGMGEVIGVYGSNTAYSNTTQAWQGYAGEKIGELVKGYKDELTITKDYEYLLFRAEPHKQQPDDIRSYVFIRSLNIGWEATLQPCEKPQIDFAAGEFHFTCPTEGATFNYSITPSTEKKGQFLLTVTAVAPGYAPSEATTISFSGSELVKASGDIDENGILNIADLTQLINKLHNK